MEAKGSRVTCDPESVDSEVPMAIAFGQESGDPNRGARRRAMRARERGRIDGAIHRIATGNGGASELSDERPSTVGVGTVRGELS